MTQPPDDLFGATATDPLDEQASDLLDAGRTPDEPGIEPALAARLRAMTAARLAVRSVPAADPARREAALVAALAAFDTAGSTADTEAPGIAEIADGGSSSRPSSLASGPAAARAARRWAPQRLLGIAAALAVFAAGAFVVGRLGTGESSKSSSAGSFGAAGGATTAAAASGLSADEAQAKAAGSQAAATTAAAAASTAAVAPAVGAAGGATTAAAATAIAPGPSATDAAALPSLGGIDDVKTLRRRLDAIRSLPAAPTTAPGTGPPVPTSAPARPGQTDGSAFTITRGADCSNRGTVLATLTWQGTPAFVVIDANGVAVLAATDCHELART